MPKLINPETQHTLIKDHDVYVTVGQLESGDGWRVGRLLVKPPGGGAHALYTPADLPCFDTRETALEKGLGEAKIRASLL